MNIHEKTRIVHLCMSQVEHQLIMSYFTDDGYNEVYCSVHLKPETNIFKKIWNAVRYIFGYRSAYGDFDEFIFKPEDADRLQKIVDYLKRENETEKGQI